MQVATHPGNFHADDVFAVAVLGLVHGSIDVVRTRDDAALAAADLRVDIGGRTTLDRRLRPSPARRRRRARERHPVRELRSRWREYGAGLAGGEEAAAAIDERLVQGVDANDTGQNISTALFEGIRPMSVSGVIAGFNPPWDVELSPAEEDALFAEAVALATGILERELRGAKAYRRGLDLVRAAIERSTDPRVVELDRKLAMARDRRTTAPDALYVVYPKSDGWGMQAVPVALGDFTNRKDLPAAWAGLSDTELAAVTGVPDAMFAHTSASTPPPAPARASSPSPARPSTR